MLTKEEYDGLKAKLAEEEKWVDSIRQRRKCRKCKGTGRKYHWYAKHMPSPPCPKCDGSGFVLGWASYKPENKPVEVPTVTNEERAAVEVYEWITNPPERYFLYVKALDAPPLSVGPRDLRYKGTTRVGSRGLATGWTGERLGDVVFGRTWESAFGDVRVSINVYGTNGRTYAGVYYKSAGDYARVKQVKGESR